MRKRLRSTAELARIIQSGKASFDPDKDLPPQRVAKLEEYFGRGEEKIAAAAAKRKRKMEKLK